MAGPRQPCFRRELSWRGARLQAAGVNAMELARGLHIATTAAVEALRARTQPVSTETELAHIAYSVTGNRALSALLGEIRALLLAPRGMYRLTSLLHPTLNGATLPAHSRRKVQACTSIQSRRCAMRCWQRPRLPLWMKRCKARRPPCAYGSSFGRRRQSLAYPRTRNLRACP